jgi:large subunit ribosomal protein L24
MGPKRENEVPFPVTDVRLVIPYKFTQIKIVVNVAGVEEVRPVTLVKDVVVDNLVMKRHTTGIDPFTGTDHGAAEIPKDHQYDPSTGLPIFHRYIAGTEHLGLDYHLEWPWQREAPVEDSGKTEEEADDIQTRFRRLMSTWRHPFDSFKRIRSRQPEVKASAEPEGPHWTEADQEALSNRRTEKVKSHDPGFSEAWDVTDTTRNIVEANDTMVYKILESPLPPSLHQELRTDISSFNVEARKDKDAPRPVKVKRSTAKGTEASELAKARFVAAQRMKTPMRLRWELEQARKAKMVKKEPLVKEEDLLAALGAHVQTWQKAKKAESARKGKGVEEVD